jgi:uncharacterized protein YegP (UPF0339 family)
MLHRARKTPVYDIRQNGSTDRPAAHHDRRCPLPKKSHGRVQILPTLTMAMEIRLMSGKFTLFSGKNGETYFNLRAGNGEIILKSEGYKDKASARNGVESVRKNAPDATRYEKKTSASGKFHFNLKATNHQVIGSSEMYDSERSRDAGIASVMANAPDAKLGEE